MNLQEKEAFPLGISGRYWTHFWWRLNTGCEDIQWNCFSPRAKIWPLYDIQFSSVQSLSHIRLFATPKLQHTRPSCPTPTPRVYLNSCSFTRWFNFEIECRESVQFSSVTQLCLMLCDSMNCSTPGLPVHHQLPESTQNHVH